MSSKEVTAPPQDSNMEVSSSSKQDLAIVEGVADEEPGKLALTSFAGAGEWTMNSVKNWCGCGQERIARYQLLVIDEKTLKKSLLALKFGIFCDAANSTILQPNYPIMVDPDAHPESFDSTDPFDFSTATYAIPMFALLGIALSGLYSGRLSDKMGRKPLLLISMYGSMIGSIVKYLLRKTFWGFCIANLANGLVSGSLPVALAYVGDIYPNPKEKALEFSSITGFFVVGQSGGGIIAILMASTGLFAPLWVGAALMFLAGTFMVFVLIEPAFGVKVLSSKPKDKLDDEDEFEAPTEINQCALWNIILGALADNFGSAGLFPLCLSPLMFNKFYAEFDAKGEDPVLSLNGYKWLSVMVALMVIPIALVTPTVFRYVGAAGACVVGNFMTAVVTTALLLIATLPAASSGTLAGFIIVMYGGFPFTVFSQLSTSPMLDVISPLDKRGYVQGLNSTFMNLGTAFAPWILGIIADQVSTTAGICVGIGISVLAAAVNIPLMFRPGMGPEPKKVPKYGRPLLGEDKEMVEKALRGSFVPQDILQEINRERELKGEPYLLMHPRPYADDKENLDRLYRDAQTAFYYQKNMADDSLVTIATNKEDLPLICERANKSLKADEGEIAEVYKELGQWFADYLEDNGYYAYTNPVIVKQMIMSAFPVITADKELTPDNLEEILLNMQHVYGQYVELEKKKRYTRTSVFGTGSTRTFWG